MPGSKSITVAVGETLIVNIVDTDGKLLDTHAITAQKAPEPASNPDAGLLGLLAALLGPDEATPRLRLPGLHGDSSETLTRKYRWHVDKNTC